MQVLRHAVTGTVFENTYSRTAVKSCWHTDHLSWMHTSVPMYSIISNNCSARVYIGIRVWSGQGQEPVNCTDEAVHNTCFWQCRFSTASTKMHMHQPVTKQQVLILRKSKIIADWKICFSWFQKILFILRNNTFFHLHTLSFLGILIFFFPVLFSHLQISLVCALSVEFRLNIIFSFPQWA